MLRGTTYLRWVLLGFGALLVAASSLVQPRVGVCGTGHSLVAQVLGMSLVGLPRRMLLLGSPGRVEAMAGVALVNLLVFLAPAGLWTRKAPKVICEVGLVLWTSLFLLSYWLLFPTHDCL